MQANCTQTQSEHMVLAAFTSASRCLSCPGCFLANIRITSGVLKASLIAACIACQTKQPVNMAFLQGTQINAKYLCISKFCLVEAKCKL